MKEVPMSTARLLLTVWLLTILAETIPVAVFGTGIRIPAFAGLAGALAFGLGSIWIKRVERELIATATAVSIISIVAGITGHTSGGGLLMFINQLLLCAWGCVRIWKERCDLLILSIFLPLFTLGAIVEIVFHSRFFLPPGFVP